MTKLLTHTVASAALQLPQGCENVPTVPGPIVKRHNMDTCMALNMTTRHNYDQSVMNR